MSNLLKFCYLQQWLINRWLLSAMKLRSRKRFVIWFQYYCLFVSRTLSPARPESLHSGETIANSTFFFQTTFLDFPNEVIVEILKCADQQSSLKMRVNRRLDALQLHIKHHWKEIRLNVRFFFTIRVFFSSFHTYYFVEWRVWKDDHPLCATTRPYLSEIFFSFIQSSTVTTCSSLRTYIFDQPWLKQSAKVPCLTTSTIWTASWIDCPRILTLKLLT